MNRWLLPVCLALLATPARLAAQKPEERKKDEPRTKAEASADEAVAAAFRGFDKNGDKSLSREEFPGSAEQFDAADKNKDGRLSEEEFRTSTLARRMEQKRKEDQKPARERHSITPEVASLRAARFAVLDKDRDGRISRAEWSGSEDGFKQLDADGDGYLSRGEFAPAPPRGEEHGGDAQLEGAPLVGDPKELFARLDRNGDGRITRAEAGDTRVAKLFAAMDKDKDGAITEREFQDAYAQLARLSSQRDEGRSGRRERRQAYTIPFDEWDKDKDGKLTQDEFLANKEWFPLADRNRDGVLSRAEAETFVRERTHDEFVARYDQNGDGKVTREEFPGPDEVFRRTDRNGDGVVSASDR